MVLEPSRAAKRNSFLETKQTHTKDKRTKRYLMEYNCITNLSFSCTSSGEKAAGLLEKKKKVMCLVATGCVTLAWQEGLFRFRFL